MFDQDIQRGMRYRRPPRHARRTSLAWISSESLFDVFCRPVGGVEFNPDVVLLDIGLPKLNGYEACRRIRERLNGKAIILIAVTGWGQEEDVRRSCDAGFDHHLVKPIEAQKLIEVINGLRDSKE